MWDLRARLWDSHVPLDADDELSSPNNRQGSTDDANEKGVVEKEASFSTDGDSIDSGSVQGGVKDVEAITSSWTKASLITILGFIYLMYSVDALQSGASWSFTPYVTSNFSLHSLTATTQVIATIIAGLSRLPLAKILDVWGRGEGLAVMTAFLALGLIMMAATNSVQMYCAAQVFYNIGSTGIDLVLSVFISDISALKNRGLIFGLASTPFIWTTWAAGPMAEGFVNGPGWRWFYGSFAIIQPVIVIPVLTIFFINKRKARREGVLQGRPSGDKSTFQSIGNHFAELKATSGKSIFQSMKRPFTKVRASGRTIPQSIKHYFIELDIPGLVMICGGLALFLLPFSLYSFQEKRWASPMIICMLVFGIVLLVIFGLYEAYVAPKSFMPIGLLFNRTVFGSCVYAACAFVSFYIWASYFYSFLVIVNNLSVTQATYVRNIYSIVACFWAVLVGLYIHFGGYFKAPALYFGVPMSILGVACMIAFRTSDADIGLICMCQIFIAVGGGTTVICQQIAAMAATSHQNIAVVLAIQYAFASIGGAIGDSIAAAVWTGVFPARLQQYLPDANKADFASIYGDLVQQASYPLGSPARNAINAAYADAQRYMLIAAVSFLALGWFAVLVWKDIPVKRTKQTKGNVF